jgi:Flp pilus assembly protein TadB
MLILSITISLVFALAILFFFYGLNRINGSKTRQNEQMEQMIQAITSSEIEIEREASGLLDKKTWSGYWYTLALAAGYRNENKQNPGLFAIGLPFVSFFVGYLVWPRDLLGGLIFAAASLVIARIVLRTLASRRIAAMDKQLPSLLSGLRANLQANLTAQQAILSQADELKAPLGDELKALREELSVNIPLDAALNNLAVRVPSREIKFLVACIRIAIASGTELDSLIETIQKIVVQRARIADHLASAVAQVQPSIVVSAIAIPAAMLFSYYSNPENQAFWSSATGLIGLVVIVGLYAAGLFIAKKQVDRVKNA